MANTTVVNQTEWDGTRGSLHFSLASDGTALSDLLLLDISTLAPAPAAIKFRTVQLKMQGNFTLDFEIDATTDTNFLTAEVQTVDETKSFFWDFRDFPGNAWHVTTTNKAAAGFTGDLLVTSTGLASGDDFDLVITFTTD